MSEPFIAEVRIVGFTYPPKGWATCDGQPMAINQNQALFSLLGTTFGGNGTTTFNLPDLRGRVGVHPGANGVNWGTSGGEPTHTLTVGEMATHGHVLSGAVAPTTNERIPTGNYLGNDPTQGWYGTGTGGAAMHPAVVGPAGGGQAHENMQPYLSLLYCIALQGVFPSRN